MEEAREDLVMGEPESAIRALLRASELDPGNRAVQSLRAGAEAAFLNAVRKRGIHASKFPVPVASRDELGRRDLTAHEDFVLSLADGTWDIRSLVFVAPMETVEVFLAIKSLLDDGLIELRAAEALQDERVAGAQGAGV